ncbi:MAG: 6-hydroxymethylpterin diphosphokinase MptE-like protein [Candidatus Nitrosotenuis sp.]
MTIKGWDSKYTKIVKEFGYSKKDDARAALLLSSIVKRQFSAQKLRKIIAGRPVFVIGAGPSLPSAISALRRHRDVIKICADTALGFLVKNGIKPHIVVTDLDGDLKLLEKNAKSSIVVVHAHGDNIDRLGFARNFKKCIVTTQTKEVGKAHNFGGFTDGDRCVFLANHFGASKIFLFGMDFGPRIGRLSNTARSDRKTKLKKLHRGKILLEWLAPRARSDLFTLSKPLRGFTKISYGELGSSVFGQNGFNYCKYLR